MLRVLSRHIKALERQVQESVLIERTLEIENECLNLKSEWAGSKIPGLRVSNPKGLVSNKEGGEVEEEGRGPHGMWGRGGRGLPQIYLRTLGQVSPRAFRKLLRTHSLKGSQTWGLRRTQHQNL